MSARAATGEHVASLPVLARQQPGSEAVVRHESYIFLSQEREELVFHQSIQRVVQSLVDRGIGQAVLVTNVEGSSYFIHMKIGQTDVSHYVHPHKDIYRLQRVY